MEKLKILYKPDQYSQQRQHEKKRWIWPVHLAMEATWYRNMGHEVYWDEDILDAQFDKLVTEPEGLPFLSLPAPDRRLTEAFDTKYQNNGNFKHHAGTYIQSASGCVWGKCTFCVEKSVPYELRPVDDVIAEIKECKRLRFREVFDDAASFATGEWRDEFVRKLRHLDITFSCNMRFGTNPDFKAMRDAGFRMLLYGMESANQPTLDRINKGINVDDAVEELILASRAGLQNHIAIMVGIPGETREDAMRNIALARWLLIKGYAKTAQCSFYTPGGNEAQRNLTGKIYHAAFHPDFWWNKLKDIRNVDDIKYLWRGIKEAVKI